jgi:hypothetical protein
MDATAGPPKREFAARPVWQMQQPHRIQIGVVFSGRCGSSNAIKVDFTGRIG